MIPPVVKKYLLSGLQGTPDVLDGFLKSIPREDPRWDFRPDPERFTLREIMAHLADWEPIHLARLNRILHEDNPLLPDIDEGQLAAENDYAHSDPHASLIRFREGRAVLMAALRDLTDADWERSGNREVVGVIKNTEFAVLISGHDGYHTCQVAQWLAATGA